MYSFVIPVFNEQESLPILYGRMCDLIALLDAPAEIILINDGSTDHSARLMTDIVDTDPRFRLIEFSRNFGHQIAITAGLDYADGDAVIIMDADLQDPPEVVLRMVAAWRQGAEVVYGVRLQRDGDSFLKKLTASFFYRILTRISKIKIPNDTGDFRLVDRKAVLAFRSMREHKRYVRGMFSWVGFRQVSVSYVRHARTAGATKFSWLKMFSFAVDGIFGFSSAPARLIGYAGFACTTAGFLVTAVGVGEFGNPESATTGRMFVPGLVVLFGGFQLMAIGILGRYLTRIYEETRARPLYVLNSIKGFSR